MKTKNKLLLLLVALFAIAIALYFQFWNHKVKKINDYLNSFSNQKLFLPEAIVKLNSKIIAENHSSTHTVNRDMMNLFSYVFNEKLTLLLNELQLYNISFAKSSFAGFPFKIEFHLENVVENNTTSELSYLQPLTIGYNIITGNVYLSFNGQILQNFHPKDNDVKRLITLDVKVESSVSITKLLNTNMMAIVKEIDRVKFNSRNFTIQDYNTKDTLFSASNIENELTFVHDYNYSSFDDLLMYAPKSYKMHTNYNITKKYDQDNTYISSIIDILPTYGFEGSYKSKFEYTTGAPNWKDMVKVFSNIALSEEVEIKHTNNQSIYKHKLNTSVLNPEQDKFYYKFLFDLDKKFDLSGFKSITKNFVDTYKQKIQLSAESIKMLESILSGSYLNLREKGNDFGVNLKVDAAIDGEEIKVAMPNFNVTLNGANINLTNEGVLNKSTAYSQGYLGFKHPILATQILNEILSLVIKLDEDEVVIVRNAVDKTFNSIFDDIKDKSDEKGNSYKITMLSLNIGNFSLNKIKQIFVDNLKKESELKLDNKKLELLLKKF